MLMAMPREWVISWVYDWRKKNPPTFQPGDQ